VLLNTSTWVMLEFRLIARSVNANAAAHIDPH